MNLIITQLLQSRTLDSSTVNVRNKLVNHTDGCWQELFWAALPARPRGYRRVIKTNKKEMPL